ncbi:zinc carboxypeptidase family protein (macronuclear) [Tetrahymena thermophila SB210]|uniref:Zinc carboxypeptidase family protein n=1 Tax=Tetrahymena thermophila (strain SB210) TaxID=312017 RepID=W7XKI3_TETTS|nr:zinc carboxypeptidase family protein [Tetrahymena thermophila SB210]EWS74929.1 zinc carboxypeptidase family protein [Tetrahymena thermophila SB210]|eukprot:XP_012652518.1 zinc carboxypeptidase family protein [Tetrahymena thermophila SB210]
MFSQGNITQRENTDISISQSQTKLDSNIHQQKLKSDSSLGEERSKIVSNSSIQIEKYKKDSSEQLKIIDDQDNGIKQKLVSINHKTQKSSSLIDRSLSKIRIKSQIQSDESEEGFEDSQELKKSIDSVTEGQVKNTTGDEFSIQSIKILIDNRQKNFYFRYRNKSPQKVNRQITSSSTNRLIIFIST